MFSPLTTSLAILLAAAPIAALSQEVPSYADQSQVAPGDQQLRGRITSFDGAYNVTVRDERGYLDNVALHDGTIINPTGLTLAPGMTVSILGYNAGDSFAANEIDTPYSYDSGVPYYSGHPWNYYGSDISLAFFFGNPGWWHGNDFHGGYTYYGGARYYNDVRIRNVYNYGGGSFRGRTYVAPANRGGYYNGRGNGNGAPRVRPDINVRDSNVRDSNVNERSGNAYPTRYAAPPQNATYPRPQNRDAGSPRGNIENRAASHVNDRLPVSNATRPQRHVEARPQAHDGGGHEQGHGGGGGHEQGHGGGHDVGHDGGPGHR